MRAYILRMLHLTVVGNFHCSCYHKDNITGRTPRDLIAGKKGNKTD